MRKLTVKYLKQAVIFFVAVFGIGSVGVLTYSQFNPSLLIIVFCISLIVSFGPFISYLLVPKSVKAKEEKLWEERKISPTPFKEKLPYILPAIVLLVLTGYMNIIRNPASEILKGIMYAYCLFLVAHLPKWGKWSVFAQELNVEEKKKIYIIMVALGVLVFIILIILMELYIKGQLVLP